MSSVGEPAKVPAPFERILEAVRAVLAAEPVRPEVTVEETPAPRRLAPYATALSATVLRGDDIEIATGRLIVLYDPAGRADWEGAARVVTYLRADLEPDIASDPLLGAVGWSWLTEALESHGVGFAVPSGTVTRMVSESFGTKGEEPATTEVELRASWTATDDAPSAHIAAWFDLLCTMAGLPPAGVSPLPRPAPRPGEAPT